MKVMIAYPALSGKGSPMLTQNRQFQWYHEPSYIYPVVSASAATILSRAGHRVIWYDGIAHKRDYPDFIKTVREERPDLIVMESKTPVIRQHWRIIDDIKDIDTSIRVALTGDHVTALPGESMERSSVDFVLTGGYYDFALSELVKNLDGAGDRPPGLWFRKQNGEIGETGPFRTDYPLETAPFIDRELTRGSSLWREMETPYPFFLYHGRQGLPMASMHLLCLDNTLPGIPDAAG